MIDSNNNFGKEKKKEILRNNFSRGGEWEALFLGRGGCEQAL